MMLENDFKNGDYDGRTAMDFFNRYIANRADSFYKLQNTKTVEENATGAYGVAYYLAARAASLLNGMDYGSSVAKKNALRAGNNSRYHMLSDT